MVALDSTIGGHKAMAQVISVCLVLHIYLHFTFKKNENIDLVQK